MTAGIVLEFAEGIGEKEYLEVNSRLGLDMGTGAGDWPEGLLSHSAGPSEGGFIVVEIWESREAQAAFMKTRLGPIFHDLSLPQPVRVVWYDVTASQRRA